MKLYKISNKIDKKRLLKDLNVQNGGISIMIKKMDINLFFIKDLKIEACNILKQDCLSIGADLAVPAGVINNVSDKFDVILMGTDKHIKILSKKELSQPFELKEVAKELKNFLNNKSYKIEIMGIINANDDSFFSGSRFTGKNAINKIIEMKNDGADIIDIGGVSSKPNSEIISDIEELKRVKPIIDEIYKSKLYNDITFSLDSYQPLVLNYALDKGFKIINDITGLENDEVCKIVSRYKSKVIIMHKQGIPKTMQDNPHYNNVIIDISDFFEKRILKAKKFKIEDIILDVGIGFGKTLENNLDLIKNLAHFKKFNLPILVGASRKSMIDKIISSEVNERLAGTLAIHLKSIDNGASIIRCHDVKEHYQAIKVYKEIIN